MEREEKQMGEEILTGRTTEDTLWVRVRRLGCLKGHR